MVCIVAVLLLSSIADAGQKSQKKTMGFPSFRHPGAGVSSPHRRLWINLNPGEGRNSSGARRTSAGSPGAVRATSNKKGPAKPDDDVDRKKKLVLKGEEADVQEVALEAENNVVQLGEGNDYYHYDPNIENPDDATWHDSKATEKTETASDSHASDHDWVNLPKWDAPFNVDNGACKMNANKRHVMRLTNVEHGSYYIGKMGLGEPAQELNMLLDTGSDEIVVKGSKCMTAGCQGRAYDHMKSLMYRINAPEDDPKKGREAVSYGSGDVWGQHVKDTVSFGPLKGHDMDLLEVQETTISEFSETTDTALEIIAGLAPGLPEYVGERMASKMEVRRFSQCLPKDADKDGWFVVNDDSPKGMRMNGPFMSMGNYYWAVQVDSMRFDWTDSQKAAQVKDSDQAIDLSNRKFSMLVDTGTTLLSLPEDVMETLDAALEKINHDCSKMDELPSIAFELDGVTHTLPPESYIAEEAKSSSTKFSPKKPALKAKEAEMEAKAGEKPALKAKEGEMEAKAGEKQAELGGHKEAVEAEEHLERQRKLKNLYYKNKKFVNSKTGTECHLLFTQPITMNSTLGQIGILGMPLFRNYAVAFDFCQRQMWTKPHDGSCGHLGDANPLRRILDPLKHRAAKLKYDNSTEISGPRLKYIPGTDRISSGARWLLSQSALNDERTIEL